MARPRRLDYPGARHHVMNRGARRSPIFFDHECCGLFLELVGSLPERFDIRVHGYALMPNHFHLLVETPAGNLSRAIGSLCGRYAQRLNHDYEWDGPLYRGRFKNRVVEDEDYWRHLLAYIHLNPVRGGLVSRMLEADWTSHAVYLGVTSRPAWLHVDDLLSSFGSVEAYSGYVDDVRSGCEETPEGFDESVLFGRALSRPVTLYRSPDRIQSPQQTFEEAMLEVQHVTGLPMAALKDAPRGRRGNRARWVVVWWLRWRDRLPGVAVARALGIHPSRVSQLMSNARRKRDSDVRLDDWMTRLEGLYEVVQKSKS